MLNVGNSINCIASSLQEYVREIKFGMGFFKWDIKSMARSNAKRRNTFWGKKGQAAQAQMLCL